MIESLIEIIIPILACYLLIKFRFKRNFSLNNTFQLFETLIVFTAIGSIIGLYLNDLVYDFIDHYFNLYSIIFGTISTMLLILSYKTRFTKWFFLIDLVLWIMVLTIKGGYKVGFSIGIPWPSIILFDTISTIIRFQLFRKLIFDIKLIAVIILTIIIILLKILYLGYPLMDKIL
ncbi:MAG: hypothetical protein GQ564_12400 [Bacteroidales bacterium]|nr:hypothetical protein [Bacteroidales bacterium]